MNMHQNRARRGHALTATAVAVLGLCASHGAHAYKFQTDGDWDLNLDTSLQYTLGVRAQ